jgi:hypothetical protein
MANKTGDRVGRGVLLSQKQAGSPKPKFKSNSNPNSAPAATPRPTTQETITLASGELHSVIDARPIRLTPCLA